MGEVGSVKSEVGSNSTCDFRLPTSDFFFSPILKMMEKASKKLQYPKITFSQFVLSRAGSKSKAPGAVYVSPPDRQAGWYARIELDGSLTKNKAKPYAGLEGELAELAADTAGYAAEHGHLTGNCCFCCRTLSDERSLSVGYGETCAKNWGLPYPEAKTKSKRQLEIEELASEISDWCSYGSETVYKHRIGPVYSGFNYTEAVRTLASKCGAYWLLDAIASYQKSKILLNSKMSQGFQIWELKKTSDTEAILTGSWDAGKVVITQEIQYTDFPFDYVKLVLENQLLFYPEER